MRLVALIYRRLREGKTFDDYRKAWYHTHGFGAPTRMYTVKTASIPEKSYPSESLIPTWTKCHRCCKST